jgi:hypothetical protein
MDMAEYDAIIRHLVSMMVKQDDINERLTTAAEEAHDALVTIHYDLVRIEQTLAKMISPSTNGKD